MKIEHIAIWTKDLESVKEFYEKYFHTTASEKYFNPTRNFESYFLRFEDGARLEIMRKPEITFSEKDGLTEFIGLAHFSISVGSKEKVNVLTEQLRHDGFQIIGDPRTTGDGYYESVILDPEGNRIEITV